MSLFHEMQVCAFALVRDFLRRITNYGLGNDLIVILDDIFIALGRCELSEKAFSQLQEKNEYQVINAHKDIIA